MILDYTPIQGLALVDVYNFKAFKLRMRDSAERRPQIGGVSFLDDDNALIDIALAPSLSGAGPSSDWQAAYQAMLAAAAKSGWIDTERSAIRAHVERAP